MTTPQDMLYKVYYEVNALMELFRGDPENEDEGDLFTEVRDLRKQNQEILVRIGRLEDHLVLVANYLNKMKDDE